MRPTEVHPLSVHQSLGGKHLLVTGVTGFLGKVWILDLLQHLPDVGRITVLVRGRRGEHAVDRTERVLGTSPALRAMRTEHGARLSTLLSDHIDVLPGELTEPNCGVPNQVIEELAGSVDVMVNFAGTVDFQPDPLQAIAINAEGALNAGDLAQALGVPLVHVSTAYVAGRVNGRVPEVLDPNLAPSDVRFDPSQELAELKAALAPLGADRTRRQERIDLAQARADHLGFPNLYTYSKSLAERLLTLREGLDVTIVRPSIVECARAFPFVGWNEGLNTSAPLAWLISTAFRDFPSRPHHHFDIAPVDLVSRGVSLATAAALSGQGGGVMHLGTSGSNPVQFGRIIELTGLANRRRLRQDPNATPYQRMVVAHLDPIAVDAERRPLWHVSRLRKGAKAAQRWLSDAMDAELPGGLDTLAGDSVRSFSKKNLKRTNDAVRNLGRIETMLELFQPFVHDHDYVFENDRIRALSAGLPEEERAQFSYDENTIDWRDYWYNVQYPGLYTWSIPVLEGKRIEDDPALEPPVRLRHAGARALTAMEGK
ncbi:MAG: SDR family oxidoreductase [Myxococcota bacterium]